MGEEASGPDLTDEAAQWLAALDAGTADRDSFERWRAADPRHAIAFARVNATWRDLDNLRPLRDRAALDTSALPAEAARDMPRRHLLRYAAGLAGVAVVGGGVATRSYARSSAETGIGERRTLVLDPGCRVELNTNSRILWRMRGGERRLWIERGEVAIEVARAESAPVQLHAADQTLDLAAGSYNARLQGDSCALTVLAGAARATGLARPATAGAHLLVTNSATRLEPSEPASLDRVTAWRRGEIVLSGESLDYAVAEYNRYLDHPLTIGDPALSRLRLGGRFTTTDPAPFLRALNASFGVRWVPDGSGGLILTRS